MKVREPESTDAMAALFRELKQMRYGRTTAGANARRSLSPAERDVVLRKTGGRCHVCGGEVDGDWHADHIAAHSTGGVGAAANLLAAHSLCNGYRKRFLPEEVIYVLKLGVWAKTEIEKLTPVGRAIGNAFVAHEKARRKRSRRRSSPAP